MRFIAPTLLTGFFAVIAAAMLGMSGYWATFEEAAPQPINFPHNIHAGKLGITCVTCHVYVDKSKFATVPAVQICINCHGKAPSQSPEVDKLKQYWADQQPIPWVRIHQLAKFVYFSHKRHIKYFSGKGESYEHGEICQKCHGDMTVVQTVKQVRTLQMGFCISCHQANGAPRDCVTCHQ